MVVIGAGGFAKELLSCITNNSPEVIKFFDDVNPEIQILFDIYQVYKSTAQVKAYFDQTCPDFTLGLGNPFLRKRMYDKFVSLGGNFVSVISEKSFIGAFDIELGKGVNVLAGVNISNSVSIGKGTLIYYNSNITHDCKVGDFVQISPGVNLLGRITVGNYTTIGAVATILPDITIGSNVIVGAGAVVTKDIPDNCLVVGTPAKIIKELSPLDL